MLRHGRCPRPEQAPKRLEPPAAPHAYQVQCARRIGDPVTDGEKRHVGRLIRHAYAIAPAVPLERDVRRPRPVHFQEVFAPLYPKLGIDIDATTRTLLCDAQTSGGLLIAVPADGVDQLIEALDAAQTLAAARIGAVVEGPAGSIRVAD